MSWLNYFDPKERKPENIASNSKTDAVYYMKQDYWIAMMFTDWKLNWWMWVRYDVFYNNINLNWKEFTYKFILNTFKEILINSYNLPKDKVLQAIEHYKERLIKWLDYLLESWLKNKQIKKENINKSDTIIQNTSLFI